MASPVHTLDASVKPAFKKWSRAASSGVSTHASCSKKIRKGRFDSLRHLTPALSKGLMVQLLPGWSLDAHGCGIVVDRHAPVVFEANAAGSSGGAVSLPLEIGFQFPTVV